MKLYSHLKPDFGQSDSLRSAVLPRSGDPIHPPRVVAVIVLYRQQIAECASYQSLLYSAAQLQPGALELEVVLWDNTPCPQNQLCLPEGVRYIPSKENKGLSSAYNQVLERAAAEGADWLLTLDQDTCLPGNFLPEIAQVASTIAGRGEIAAILPQIIAAERMVSPNYFIAGAWPRWFPLGYVGVPDQATFGFNSGATLRISALRQVGGYDQRFWLDNSDAAIFRKLQKYGKRVFVLGALQVEHDFSMLHLNERVSLERYRNVLLAETAFWDLEMNVLAGLERTARLIVRYFKHRKRDRHELKVETVEFLRRRFLYSRTKRLQVWKEETYKLVGDTMNRKPFDGLQPKVSVCMATYNGERYVAEQLRSILKQLTSNDEVIIVDDCSTDNTRKVIRELEDSRISLIAHNTNMGVVITFEDSIRNASGDILFFSDQDDIWDDNKVLQVLGAFRELPDVDIVCSAIQAIDEVGKLCHDDVYSNQWPFTAGVFQNLVSNRFQGSAMAFRARLISRILPFPSQYYILHDVWIGLRNTITGGGTFFIPEPLLFYRRHSMNVSSRLSRYHQVKKRLHLLWALCIRGLRDAY